MENNERLDALARICLDRGRFRCRWTGLRLERSSRDAVEMDYRKMEDGFHMIAFTILDVDLFPMQMICTVLDETGEWTDISHCAHPASAENLELTKLPRPTYTVEWQDVVDDILSEVSRSKQCVFSDLKRRGPQR